MYVSKDELGYMEMIDRSSYPLQIVNIVNDAKMNDKISSTGKERVSKYGELKIEMLEKYHSFEINLYCNVSGRS